MWPHCAEIVEIYHPEGLHAHPHAICQASCSVEARSSILLFIDGYQHFLISAKQNTTLAQSRSLRGSVQQLKEVRHSCEGSAHARAHSCTYAHSKG